jgi:hypothetical protein
LPLKEVFDIPNKLSWLYHELQLNSPLATLPLYQQKTKFNDAGENFENILLTSLIFNHSDKSLGIIVYCD